MPECKHCGAKIESCPCCGQPLEADAEPTAASAEVRTPGNDPLFVTRDSHKLRDRLRHRPAPGEDLMFTIRDAHSLYDSLALRDPTADESKSADESASSDSPEKDD